MNVFHNNNGSLDGDEAWRFTALHINVLFFQFLIFFSSMWLIIRVKVE